MPFEIPDSWEWVRFGDISEVVRGGSPRPAGSAAFYNGNIPFLKVADLTNDNGVFVNSAENSIKEAGLTKTRFVKSGTLLLTNSGATLGVPKITNIDTTFNDGIAAFLYLDKNIKLYSYWYLRSQTNNLRAINQGAGQPNLNTDLIKSLFIPLPPAEEQVRIVTAIENMFLLLDYIEKDKRTLNDTIQALKSKILDNALCGTLVPQNPDDTPAIELLRAINHNIQPCDTSHYENLPKGWTVCELQDVIELLDNKRKPIKSEERTKRIEGKTVLYPYYGATGFVGYIDEYLIDGRFILLGEDGAPFLDKFAEKAYAVEGKIWVNNHAHVILPKIDFDYLKLYLNALDYHGIAKGTTRLKLTQGDMNKIPVLVPPLEEQKRISKCVQKMFEVLNAITDEL